ncbi:hypothetical protein V6N11_079826 [Hibiscus sabdariffa]|uniref:Uncharacterized protein n=1 Tax=Hibiscus sabdariffa TaxID=183260 RepID=A0ABR2RXE8_9ROSI
MKHARSKGHSAPFVPIHPVLGQDNAPPIPIDPVPNQDYAQRSRKSWSTLPAKSLVNWVVSEKQRPNGRFDKYSKHKYLKFVCRSKMEVSRYENFGIRPSRPKKAKFNQEQTQTPQSLLALPWKDKATDHELKEFINESLKKMHKADASTSTIAKGIPH